MRNHERQLGKKGNPLGAGVAGREGAPDLLDSFNFQRMSFVQQRSSVIIETTVSYIF